MPTPTAPVNPQVAVETSLGSFTIELYPDKAPLTVQNFLDYVANGFYDGTIFHRVIPNFMIQCGGFQPGMRQKTTKAAIQNESTNGLTNDRGTVAMARTNVPNSATSQFFVNTVTNDFLNKANSRDNVGYCVFGKVVSGLDVVDKIAAVRTMSQGAHQNVPAQDVLIVSARKVLG
jgi:cyclophilin family peptidyl-prolyl cis-trans isomerase